MDKMGLHVFCPNTDSLCGEGESSCSPFCGRDRESKIFAPQYLQKPSFRLELLMLDLPGISFVMRMETGLLTFEIFYFRISNLSAEA